MGRSGIDPSASLTADEGESDGRRTASERGLGRVARSGGGRLNLKSGAAGTLPVTWASRTERSEGKTSPEELIAAAHAGCFAMALSHELTEGGTPPASLDVTATCTFDQVDGAFRVTGVHLTVEGIVPDLDEGGFVAAAQAAKAGCPVSNALSDSVKITVEARLAAT
jgi:osmotically inducible protein OsmC